MYGYMGLFDAEFYVGLMLSFFKARPCIKTNEPIYIIYIKLNMYIYIYITVNVTVNSISP